MTRQWNRRELLAHLAGASAGILLPQGSTLASTGLRVAGEDCEVQLTSVSANTLRLSVLPLKRSEASRIASDGSLVKNIWGSPAATIRSEVKTQTVQCGNMKVLFSPNPLSFNITSSEEQMIQQLSIDEEWGYSVMLMPQVLMYPIPLTGHSLLPEAQINTRERRDQAI